MKRNANVSHSTWTKEKIDKK